MIYCDLTTSLINVFVTARCVKFNPLFAPLLFLISIVFVLDLTLSRASLISGFVSNHIHVQFSSIYSYILKNNDIKKKIFFRLYKTFLQFCSRYIPKKSKIKILMYFMILIDLTILHFYSFRTFNIGPLQNNYGMSYV